MRSFKEFKANLDEACWKGYKQIGTKTKNGKEVPNCVPESIEEKKLPHALDPNKSLKHAMQDRGFDKDNDGDVDKFDKNTPDEITGAEKINQTPKMMKKYAGELKHTKKGMAYEQKDEPASPDEKGMAIDQAKFIKYVGDEIMEYLGKDKEFPEWMQNKLSGLHEKAKDMHAVMAGKYDESVNEGSETWESGYKRRVVKTTDPDHKEKGHKWRIKGKDRPEISIKLYKEKPSYKEFTKQMKRVAGHEFGG